MGTWNLYTRDSGDVWTIAYAMPRPNDDLDLSRVSTQAAVKLADGSLAYITPYVKYNENRLQFTWEWDDGTLVTNINTYIEDQEDIKIITHVSGRNFIGRFIEVKSTWMTGQNPDKYKVEATFEIMDI